MADDSRYSVIDVLEQIRDSGGATAAAGLTNTQLRAAPVPITGTSDVILLGPAAQSAINVDLLTGTLNGWFDASLYRAGVVQIIASAGISAGAVIFEQTNDPVLASAGVPVAATELTLASPNILLSGNNIAASTTRMFGLSLMAAFFRVRISTAFVGGTVRASAVFSQDSYANSIMNVQQGSAGNLSVTATLAAGTAAAADVGGVVRTAVGGLTAPKRLAASLATINADFIKSGVGRLYKIRGYNNSTTAKYLKLYNKATAPVVATDVPTDTYTMAPGAAFDLDFDLIGRSFTTGLAFCITGLPADTDATALAAGDVTGLNFYFA